MTDFLGMREDSLAEAGGIYTAREISRQPGLWKQTYDLVHREKDSIEEFLDRSVSDPTCNIILTGAGSSAFIGNSMQGTMQQSLDRNVQAVPTTDLVSHPGLYLRKNTPTLLISFARSGDSPESHAAVSRADDICNNVHHLVITCNPEGKLAKECRTEKDFILLLPPESNDESLAMTSSFTCMLLSGILISHIKELDLQKQHVERLAAYGERMLSQYTPALNEVAGMEFTRAVFLGSGPLQGIAQESQLKLQELTNGMVICKHDSFLGFRHGPKAVIDNTTLLVYLVSNNPQAVDYEKDLIRDIEKSGRGLYSIAVSENRVNDIGPDLEIICSAGSSQILPEEYLAIVNVLPSQCLGFYKSLRLGLSPDIPSMDGTITRVVTGVTIYPFKR
jgi:tagatose-6-phosphate ketose/aldose isomerase